MTDGHLCMIDASHVSLSEIRAAAGRLTGRASRTPLEMSRALSRGAGVPVYLKLETRQITGSFKFRGATNAVLSLADAERAAGVVAVSTGNHGRGLARAASEAGVRCVIAMSRLVPENKVEGIRNEGAEVLISGASQDEAQLEVDRLVAGGMTMLPPFDHRDIIAGQGTIGLEILEDLPDVATVLVPLSGGGLISGVAAAIRSQRPEVRIIGVSMERGAAMQASLAAGHPVEVEELPTLADSLGGGIGLHNAHTFAMVRDLVKDVVLLDESEIAAGIRHCYWEERQIVEGAGAVCVAALLSGKVRSEGPVVAVLSGANIDMKLHHRIVSGETVDIAGEAA
ncbi:hydroxyectoine utilization dehydratase EutB [Ovoidimarina sediminis]|uniref:hydroxyectoine utilization dehydratase EutB n=1 Tax=Ovoidimarina sediminis TaxID=3079856 RepID=UPI00290F6106|nr:hydroxyectoine utilization dehydratase EutB [Rhodophyticola sp. MJ-SS7]MDU8944651.1 hydroxyectoine utilization dehydratase EutB [Rhodophyticola sp. MJ-SS7]